MTHKGTEATYMGAKLYGVHKGMAYQGHWARYMGKRYIHMGDT